MGHRISVYSVVAVIFAITLSSVNAQKEDEDIVFAEKNFFDSGQINGDVAISGTLTGEGLSYRNNTYSVTCYYERRECFISSIEQIGPKLIGRLAYPEIYPITKWNAYEVVATEDASDFRCAKVTITISRKSGTALWVQEPINQTRPACQKSDTKTHKWTIEDSLGGKRMKGK